MKRLSLIGIGIAASALCALGQAPDPFAPSSVTPKEVERSPGGGIAIQRPKSPRTPAGDKPISADKPDLAITGILIVKTRAEVQAAGSEQVTGIVVKDIPILERPDFKWSMQPYLGRLLTENTIRDLQDEIILYCRNRGKLLVDVVLVPEQNIENGVLRLWFLQGKVGKITINNEGKKWFSDMFISEQVRLHPGDEIESTRLNEDLNWLNTNPFRQVNVAFKQGEELALTDLELQVDDRLPLRGYFGYENSGTRFTGENRLLAGFNWGNAFGLDHQLNYQYSTDIEFDLVKAHSASYLAPLPWRHNLLIYGSYVDGKADFTDTGTTSEARSWQTSIRYSVPLPRIHKFRHEAAVGFDFKRSNNDLLAGGQNVLQTSDTDIDQFAASYTGVLPDKVGQTSFGLEVYYSPGHLSPNNNDSDFNQLRVNASADYFYGRLNIERITRLPYDFSYVLRGWGQLSSDRLLPSEEIALGGYSTVRGYDERVVIGDNGIIINNELRTPPIPLGLLTLDDQLQILGFFDFGAERVIDPTPADGQDPDKIFYSAGVGFRYTVARNFSLRFDYGVPLTEKSLNEHNTRIHVGALLSF
jgi:hemolysin activation/secretion protein